MIGLIVTILITLPCFFIVVKKCIRDFHEKGSRFHFDDYLNWLINFILLLFAGIVFYGLVCLFPASIHGIYLDRLDEAKEIHHEMEVQQIIFEYEKDHGIELNDDFKKDREDLKEKIEKYNSDLKYLQEHDNSKWNGICIPSFVQDMEEIEIPSYLE